MDRNFAAITIFTLLFAVSTARISLDPTPTNLNVAYSKFHRQPACALEESNLRFVPTETKKPGSDKTLESDSDRDVKIDLTPRSDFARFYAINRHFFDEPRVPIRSVHTHPHRQFQNPYVKPRSKISHENEVTVTESAQNQDSSKWLKFKRDYQHERYQHQHQHQHHQHQHQHHQRHNIVNDNNDISLRKHKFVGEKINSLVHQHKQKTRAPEAAFLTSIRKFMKHTFE